MPKIRQLPASVVNKIAAGEVIERPASLVKELLENSVDAGAKRVQLTVEKGGLELIRVSDDGCGMSVEDLPLAVAAHATSKLIDADQLFDIHTLGFRGEALASIAEVSHLTIRSRTPDSDSGTELAVEGGIAQPLRPCGCPVGTVMEVRHLFFNTPVRRKFLRSAQTEMGHVTEAFTRIALAFPQVHMILSNGDRTVYDLPPTEAWSERVRAFFGDEVGDSLIYVESVEQEARLRGYVCNPTLTRSNNRMQYLFLNGRHIRDRSLQHALSEAYRGLVMVGRFPVCFLRLDIPPNSVDVNVHPTKMEVRFQDGGKLYSQILSTLRNRFLTTDLTAQVKSPQGSQPTSAVDDEDDAMAFAAAGANAPDRWKSHTQSMVEWARGGQSDNRSDTPADQTPSRSVSANMTARLPWDTVAPFQPFPSTGRDASVLGTARGSNSLSRDNNTRAPFGTNSGDSESSMPPGAIAWSADKLSPHTSLEDELPGLTLPDDATLSSSAPQDDLQSRRHDAAQRHPTGSHIGIQVHNRYLITQDDQGMVVIDQHALHERIMYEQIREKVLGGHLESQRLLVPEPVTLTPSEAAVALDHQEVLAKIGINIEPFGGDTVLITSYPAMLANMSPSDMLRQVLEQLMNTGKQPEARDLLDSLLHMISCKAAIKAGDRLSPEEITTLLEQRDYFQDSHHCPHGRPTALFFSREQLDKMFKRT